MNTLELKLIKELDQKNCILYMGLRKNHAIGFFITLFTGWFGGQFFYLGNYIAGAFCLIFFWTGIPGLVSLFYLFLITSSVDEYNIKLLNSLMQPLREGKNALDFEDIEKFNKVNDKSTWWGVILPVAITIAIIGFLIWYF